MSLDNLDLELVDRWQRDFPLVDRPYEALGTSVGVSEQDVISRLRRLSGIGRALAYRRSRAAEYRRRVHTGGAGGSPAELEAIARLVAAEPGVNHAYEREHAYNFWFVVTARDKAAVDATIAEDRSGSIDRFSSCRWFRDFHIDLGFSMFGPPSRHFPEVVDQKQARIMPQPADRSLLVAIETGIELEPRPIWQWPDVWAGVSRRSCRDSRR